MYCSTEAEAELLEKIQDEIVRMALRVHVNKNTKGIMVQEVRIAVLLAAADLVEVIKHLANEQHKSDEESE